MNSLSSLPTTHADFPWYVVWTEARAEKKIAERLRQKGYSVWLPTVTEKHRWSDRWQLVTRPLFPGYLFAATGEGYGSLLRTPGVLTLVKNGVKPVALSADYVSALRRLADNPSVAPEATQPTDPLATGDEVSVCDGPLAGFRGTVVELRGARRLVIWIASIGRGLVCVLGNASVVKVGERMRTC